VKLQQFTAHFHVTLPKFLSQFWTLEWLADLKLWFWGLKKFQMLQYLEFISYLIHAPQFQYIGPFYVLNNEGYYVA